MTTAYLPRCDARLVVLPIRGLDYHVHSWEAQGTGTIDTPLLVLLHGWMDVGASFQFVMDEFANFGSQPRRAVAPDWRGFGLTAAPVPCDSYWFPDYLGDLDALLDTLSPHAPVDLIGHSMGGNVVMAYAGIRPARVRRVVNLEGWGLPRSQPAQWPGRMAQWLDELRTPSRLQDYPDAVAVAQRLMKTNPRLDASKAAWLATRWARPDGGGRWRILGDAAHKRVNPVLYRADEHLEVWKCISAPVLWVEGEDTEVPRWWGTRYSKVEFHERLSVVPQVERHSLPSCGHMLHHDQPEAVARLLADFLAR